MIKSSCPHLFLLVIASILLLLFTIGNCNNNYDDQMETTLFEKRLIKQDHLNNLFEEENFNDEDDRISIRNILKPYPTRRSSFYAMRGKRRAISPEF